MVSIIEFVAGISYLVPSRETFVLYVLCQNDFLVCDKDRRRADRSEASLKALLLNICEILGSQECHDKV